MTVKQLIEKLNEHPPNMEVVADLHSEWAPVTAVSRVVGFDNGGYISKPYREKDRACAHGYVHLETEVGKC